MSDPCPDCGRDRVLVGIRHNCNPVREAPSVRLEAPSVAAGLRSRIVELEAEVERLAQAKPDCPVCSKRQAAKTKAQKKRRTEKKPAGI